MEATVRSYVQTLADNMSFRLNADFERYDNSDLEAFLAPMSHYPVFSWGLSIPGWVAYVNKDGSVLLSSPGVHDISGIWRHNLPIGSAVQVFDHSGDRYTVAVSPVTYGYVVAAVAWRELLGGVMRDEIWLGLIFFVILIGTAWAINRMWRRLFSPLSELANEIDRLRMGKDVPNEIDGASVIEIERIHKALTLFAAAAIERNKLHNYYVQNTVKDQEKERIDVAREIHDGPLQDVTALLQHIRIAVEDGSDVRERIKKTERLAMAVVRELRGLCDELAPPWMELGVADALTELAERLSQNYDIDITTEVVQQTPPLDLGAERNLSLLRIFQEAVSNAVRHGDATKVQGRLFVEGDSRAVFEITDNGKGFDPGVDHEILRLDGHRGLANMTERMALMGGTFQVKSTSAGGTCIRCVLNNAFEKSA
ncbi:two-component sensor histidine kinase [Synergistales bacterium]|nr:two-component sensor histidine kinase [Synergistales bacterium]